MLIKVKYSNCIEVHLRDNLHSTTNVSILESINDVQEQIISALGIHDIRLKFLQDSRWFYMVMMVRSVNFAMEN